MISPDEAAAQLLAGEKPVVFVDTCSLLDLVRPPTREKFSADHAAAAVHLIEQAEARQLRIVIAEQSHLELGNHVDEVQAEGDGGLIKFDQQLAKILGIFAAFGIQGIDQPKPLSAFGFGAAARLLVDRYVAAAAIVRTTDDATMNRPGFAGGHLV